MPFSESDKYYDSLMNTAIFVAVTIIVATFAYVFGLFNFLGQVTEETTLNTLHVFVDFVFGLLVAGNVLFFKYFKENQTLQKNLDQEFDEQLRVRRRFELATEGSQDGIWDWDVKNGTCYYSKIFKQNLGLSNLNFPEVIDSFYGVMKEDDIERFDDALQKQIVNQKPFELDIRLRTRHAGYRWFKITAVILFDNQGTIERLVGSMRDIQYRIGMQEALSKELERTDYLFQRNPALVVTFDRMGNIISSNPKTNQVSGYEEEELIGRNWWEVFFKDEEEEHYHAMIKYFKEHGEISNYELAMETKSGEKRMISWSTVNYYDENAKIKEVIGFGIDVTERNAYQSQLVEAKAELEAAKRAK